MLNGKAGEWISIVLYGGSMLLLLEWIYPLDEVTKQAIRQRL
ncbi:hypothetical protein [Piscibacillus salipiscarius]|nr:hypothetical protein [Piscibacillus salipiscarius]